MWRIGPNHFNNPWPPISVQTLQTVIKSKIPSAGSLKIRILVNKPNVCSFFDTCVIFKGFTILAFEYKSAYLTRQAWIKNRNQMGSSGKLSNSSGNISQRKIFKVMWTLLDYSFLTFNIGNIVSHQSSVIVENGSKMKDCPGTFRNEDYAKTLISFSFYLS